ncbi:hypothetical protein BASA81_017130 [Batrachochytrium salamandrivorans]|nr:hypothetical protein BASA81_017130 [Batrachochytrium salamandrivorans]
MKVNALVVAAMVITSVNAVWHDVFTGCFRGRCGMSKSESEESLLQKDGDEPKVPKPTKASPKCGSIVKELTDLRGDAYDIEATFRGQMPTHFNLMKGMDADDKKINPRILKAEQAAAYRALSNEDKAKAWLADFLQVAYHAISIYIVANTTTWGCLVEVG